MLQSEQNGSHFADEIFKCIFLQENLYTLIQISLNFFLKHLVDNSELVQSMVSSIVYQGSWCHMMSLGHNELKLKMPFGPQLGHCVWHRQICFVKFGISYSSYICIVYIITVLYSADPKYPNSVMKVNQGELTVSIQKSSTFLA